MSENEASITLRANPKSAKRNGIYSVSNEPVLHYDNNDSIITQYPDMEEAYDNFSKTYMLPRSVFILTSGTEASLRIVLSAIRLMLREHTFSTKFIYGAPGWGLLPILAEQEGFIPTPIDYKYENKSFLEAEENGNISNFSLSIDPYSILYNNPGSILYTTSGYNNYFSTTDFVRDDMIDVFEYGEDIIRVIDEVYTNKKLNSFRKEISQYMEDGKVDKFLSDKIYEELIPKENQFYIGSYSKALGCGIRLGYIIFNPRWEIVMNHQRENYISPLACMHTKVAVPYFCERRQCIRDYLKEASEDMDLLQTITPNYLLIKADDYTGPEERINSRVVVSGIEFYRLGLPLDM